LLTLTGPGGIGKTRLAIALAQASCAEHPDADCVFVDLSTIDDAGLVEARIADALGVAETTTRPLDEAIAIALSHVRLLVLDNFEHVVAAATDIARLLESVSHLKVIVTSREPLHLQGEQEFRVAPLGIPGPADYYSPMALQAFSSVQMFVARARAIDPSFEVSEANARPIVELVRRLDGLPLALELAAAHTRLLPPQALLARLQDRCDLLQSPARDTPPRHRTLAQAIRWSVDLLNDNESALFQALAVFSGGWTIEAAQSVYGKQDGDVLALLGSLLDKSLIYRESDADSHPEPRYGMLQTLRAYALELLEFHREADDCRRRHAAHFLEFAERIHPALLRSPDKSLVDDVGRDHANFRAAIQWSLTAGESSVGVRLGAALWPYWFGRCHLADGRHLLEDVLAADRDGRATSARARALGGLAALMLRQEDVAAGHAFATRALQAAEQANDFSAMGLALFELGWIARVTGDREQSRCFLERARSAAQACGDTFWNATGMEHLGILDLHEGDLASGRARLEASVGLHRAGRHTWGLAGGLLALAHAETALGSTVAARSQLAEAIEIFRSLGDQLGIANCLDAAGEVRMREGSALLASRLFAAAEAVRESVGVAATWSLEPTRVAAIDLLRGSLGQGAFDESWAAGRALSVDDAVTCGLAEEEAEMEPGTVAARGPGLTARELDVAAFIPLGLSNREIADRLFIGERTVESHVSHLLGKLQLSSRARLASWVVDAGLRAEATVGEQPVRGPRSIRKSVHGTVLVRSMGTASPASVGGRRS